MKQHYEEIKISWMGIPILIRYNPNYSKAVMDIQGFALVHIEVHTEQLLPITETGYKSIFTSAMDVEENGGAEKYIRTMLDNSATREWKQKFSKRQQLSLF